MQKKNYYRVEVPSPIETIRSRVRELFTEKARKEGLTETGFAQAMGDLTPSWANHFMAGRRNVTDITLLVKIARFFGVSVAYLIGETNNMDEARASAILDECRDLTPEGLLALLTVVKTVTKTLPKKPLSPTPQEAPGARAVAPLSKPRKRPR
jgi:transcriptional regulator with XRE-family HTH domain